MTDAPQVEGHAPFSVVSVDSVRATAVAGSYFVHAVVRDTGGVEIEGIFGITPDDQNGAVPILRQWLADNQGDYSVQPYAAPPPAPYRIAKTTPWLRMTPAEADIMDAIMSQTDAQQKQIYMAAQYLQSDDPLWSTMKQLLTDNLQGGAARANELLAPET